MKLEQFGIAIDQVVNTIAGGMADETISARAWRNRNEKRSWYLFMRFINVLFFWQEEHCLKAYLSEKSRKHLPKEYQN